jgi:hypothetical protein
MLKEFFRERAVFVALAAAALIAALAASMPAPRHFVTAPPAPSGAAEAATQAAEVPLAQAYGP